MYIRFWSCKVWWRWGAKNLALFSLFKSDHRYLSTSPGGYDVTLGLALAKNVLALNWFASHNRKIGKLLDLIFLLVEEVWIGLNWFASQNRKIDKLLDLILVLVEDVCSSCLKICQASLFLSPRLQLLLFQRVNLSLVTNGKLLVDCHSRKLWREWKEKITCF